MNLIIRFISVGLQSFFMMFLIAELVQHER